MNWSTSRLRLFLARLLDRTFPTEAYSLKHLAAFGVFAGCLAVAVWGSVHLGWLAADRYWINHLLYGIGFPLALFSVTTSMRAGVMAALAWSLGNEFWEDQLSRAIFAVDWSHLLSDLSGIALSVVVWWLLQKCANAMANRRIALNVAPC